MILDYYQHIFLQYQEIHNLNIHMNIHTLNDRNPGSANNLRSNRRQNQSRPQRQENDEGFLSRNGQDFQFTLEHLRAAEQHKVLFLCGRRRLKNPQDQNYWDMLVETLCPVISICSITILILLADLVMFIVQVSIGLYKQGDLLEVNSDTLLKLGANQYSKVKSGEVWRLVSAIFLHINFLHFFGNFITTLIFLTRVEYSLGWVRTLIIYILSGIGGNIFSDVTQPNNDAIKAGASTALFGIIGIILGYVIINWRGLSVIGSLLKCQLVCICMVIILFIFIFTPGSTTNIDYLGHLGGFLTGFWLISINPTILDQKSQKIVRVIFFLLFLAQFLICFLVFYLK